MNKGFKKTETYKHLYEKINKERDKFEKEDCYISFIIAFITTMVYCFNWLGAVWDWIYKPQETMGWWLLAACGSALSVFIVFVVAIIPGEIVNLTVSKIFFSIKFKNILNEEDNYNDMQHEYRNRVDNAFANFSHFYPSDWILNRKSEQKYYKK